MKLPNTIIYAFKVRDYTTILFGQYEEPQNGCEGYFYVQRGDGEKYTYNDSRIEYAQVIWRYYDPKGDIYGL